MAEPNQGQVEPHEGVSATRILGALRITSVTSLLTIAFGIVTNKLIAVYAGTDGVALLGLYRMLGSIVMAALSMGAAEVIMQRLSTARDPQTAPRVLGAIVSFFLAQTMAILLLALLGAPAIARALFGPDAAAHVWEVRCSLALTTGVLALQLATASLNGQAQVRESNRVSLLTSLLTVATAYPFLLLGNIGLPFIIGFTCFIGATVGFRYTLRAAGTSARALRLPSRWPSLHAALPLSPWLAVQPALMTGSGLVIQSLIARHYSLESLGFYNAASMLETTSVMVLMSSMRSFYLPMLGKLDTLEQKKRFINKMVTLLLVALLLGVATLLVGTPYIIKILFSEKFQPARPLVMVLAMSMLGQVFIWCGAMFVLHKADYRTFVFVEAVWVFVRLSGAIACVVFDLPLISVAWVHAGSCTLSGLIYGIVIRQRYGGSIYNGYNVLFGVGVLAMLLAGMAIVKQGLFTPQVGFATGVVFLCALMGRFAWRRLRDQ